MPRRSFSRYGCDVFVCVMINALIELHTALIDQFLFPPVSAEWFLQAETRHTVCPLMDTKAATQQEARLKFFDFLLEMVLLRS